MLAYMLGTLGDEQGLAWTIRSAGTHVIENSTMSARTRQALEGVVGLGAHPYGQHRSRQLTAADVQWADVTLASEAAHVRFVRRHFIEGTATTVQLATFVRESSAVTFSDRLRIVAQREPETRDDVNDPAGGDQADYDACAAQLWDLARAFAAIALTETP
jgi:protein-tyrosine-phosphatase